MHRPLRLLLILLSIAALGLAACGGGDDGQGDEKASRAEKAFLTGMAHHHGTAIEMGQIAKERGKSRFVPDLATTIVAVQKHEIGEMRSIHERLFDQALKPDPKAHDGLGLSAEEAGMNHSPAMIAALRTANPFDRAFVDDMVPHHRGAVRMAEVVMRDGRDPGVRRLARKIITDQKREVREMNSFRKRAYGAPVPETKAPGGSGEGTPGGAAHGGH